MLVDYYMIIAKDGIKPYICSCKISCVGMKRSVYNL